MYFWKYLRNMSGVCVDVLSAPISRLYSESAAGSSVVIFAAGTSIVSLLCLVVSQLQC